MKLSARLAVMWAKWERDPQALPQMHSVICHLMDVMHVAQTLWDASLGEGLQQQLANELQLSCSDARQWIAFWVGAHDLGKVSPAFQCKVPAAVPMLEAVSFKFPQPHEVSTDRPPTHGEVSAVALTSLLIERHDLPRSLAMQIAHSVGGHHGRFIDSKSANALLKNPSKTFGRAAWQDARCELLQCLAAIAELPNSGRWNGTTNPLSTQWLLTLAGFTTVADWLGSMGEVFRLAGPIEDLADYITLSQDRAKQVVADVGWSGWAAPRDELEVEDLFPVVKQYGLRPLQVAVDDLIRRRDADAISIDNDASPRCVLIEAPMGEGKTEAAMALVEHWSVQLQQRGCYFALPTMATSNQMFGRVREFLERRYADSGDRVNLLLLHGRASLSEALQELVAAARQPQGIDPRGDEAGEVIAGEWFTFRKRGLLAPFGVGTVDQVLMAVLPVKHVFVRLFGLAQKTVIIDEVHAYDAYMSVLLDRLLMWLASLGTTVVLLSATLPRARREALLAAYRRGLWRTQADEIPELGAVDSMAQELDGSTQSVKLRTANYPRLSWLTADGQTAERHFPAAKEIELTIQWKANDVADWAADLRDALEHGGCAAVICNTVTQAQATFLALQQFFHRDELDLFHARFPFEEREAREQRALCLFGKPRDGNAGLRPRRVLVATQVIEQSLDIDFDLMITEVAPIDLILQRAGRLQRHVVINNQPRVRPVGFETPTLWLLRPQTRVDGLPDWGSSGWVYAPHILLKTWLALHERSRIALPADIEPLIETVYDESQWALCLDSLSESSSRASYEAELLSTFEALRTDRDSAESEAESALIKPPARAHEGSLRNVCSAELEEDAPDLHPAFQARTRRDSLPSISVVCLSQSSDGLRLRPDGPPVSLDDVPDPLATESFIRRSVSISHVGIVRELKQHGLSPPTWQKNALLRSLRVLIFNAERSCDVGHFTLLLDADRGLVFLNNNSLEDL